MESVYVDAQTLRQRFNALDYYGAVGRGELEAYVVRESLASAKMGFAAGTKSQTVFYMRGQVKVALVHQFIRPDGTLAGSGLPDPKWLRDGSRILKLAPVSS